MKIEQRPLREDISRMVYLFIVVHGSTPRSLCSPLHGCPTPSTQLVLPESTLEVTTGSIKRAGPVARSTRLLVAILSSLLPNIIRVALLVAFFRVMDKDLVQTEPAREESWCPIGKHSRFKDV
jgi:hypothetical protein